MEIDTKIMGDMNVLVIYYEKDDDVIINYVKDFTNNFQVFAYEKNSSLEGLNVITGNILNILDDLKGKVNVVALKKKKFYGNGDFKFIDLVREIKSRGYKILLVD